ncbi:thioredoxin O, mitochondrial-like isoform X2 [Triticum dicoccoides]|uniref:thioredoxin O, mitochondrial-like isoform X2 n=1 Tax=Triticum dicoccoides TaxID=85692 RepID=UPI0018913ECD|nr:thioredoxin O, mitochondrial-like isoform X2 [Triticum dicoccoides]
MPIWRTQPRSRGRDLAAMVMGVASLLPPLDALHSDGSVPSTPGGHPPLGHPPNFVLPQQLTRPSTSSSSLTGLFSSSSTGDSSMVVVGSADTFKDIHAKVQVEKLPAVFYYTAVWCGSCRAMAPVIEKMSRQYPKIPVYKVDIDMHWT